MYVNEGMFCATSTIDYSVDSLSSTFLTLSISILLGPIAVAFPVCYSVIGVSSSH